MSIKAWSIRALTHGVVLTAALLAVEANVFAQGSPQGQGSPQEAAAPAPAAGAQPSPAEEARRLAEEAGAARRQGKHVEAAKGFTKAYQVSNNASFLRHAYESYRSAEDWEMARDCLALYLKEETEPIGDRRRLEGKLDAMERALGPARPLPPPEEEPATMGSAGGAGVGASGGVGVAGSGDTLGGTGTAGADASAGGEAANASTSGGGGGGTPAGMELGPEAPSGAWIGGGLHAYAAGPGARVEVGIPLGTFNLSLQIAASYWGYVLSFFGYTWSYHNFGFFPGLHFEYPVYKGYGRFSIVGEGGLGFVLALFTIPAQPYVPEQTYRSYFGAVRIAAGGRYVFPFGLFFDLKPVGISVTGGSAAITDPITGGITQMFAMGAAYEFSSTVGFRFK